MTAFPEGVIVFPVRHHSPRASEVLRRVLDAARPALVLVEGPADGDALIDALTAPDTVPPVALLGYRTDGEPGSVLYPFASYSPEHVALAWARANGVAARFCDLTTGQSLALDRDEGGETDVEPASDPDLGDVSESAARARGYRSFEEMWEALFEAPRYEPRAFTDALLAYAELVRARGRDPIHRARDALMARRVREAIAAGTAPDRIAVVVGAAHAAAFVAGDVDPSTESLLSASVPTTTTLVPYSFPRLAEQLGYGAGNRAPRYYQRAHDAGCDYARATLEILIEFAEHLRLRGFSASMADVIEAYRLAIMLARIRDKTEPGLDELREATIATLCRGESAHVDAFLWPSVIGRSVGKVGARVARNSLQEEFWREVEARRLPRTDEPETFALRLGDEVQVETSVLLHRLRLANVPYATFQGAVSQGRARAEEAGGHAALARVRETWTAQWTPATDVALVERIVMGESLAGVTTRVLEERLLAAHTTEAAADVLLEAVVAGAPRVVPDALAACDRFAATDDDLLSLARACRSLAGLVAYGTSRARSVGGDAAIPPLCTKTFARAVLRLHTACVASGEAVPPAREAMRVLHEIALAPPIHGGAPLVDAEAWFTESRGLVHDYDVDASCAGTAAGLLHLAERLSDDEIAELVSQRLSDVARPEPAAAFVEGFFEVNALVLVKSRPVVAALDAYLVAIDRERFVDALPTLRRAFGELGATERRYLVENLLAVRRLGAHAKEAMQVIDARDREELAKIGEDLAKAMDDLDDLL